MSATERWRAAAIASTGVVFCGFQMELNLKLCLSWRNAGNTNAILIGFYSLSAMEKFLISFFGFVVLTQNFTS